MGKRTNLTLDDYLEDINGDHSSIYMCSNQRLVDFQVAGTTISSPPQVTQDSYLPTSSAYKARQKWLDNYIEVWDIIAEVE